MALPRKNRLTTKKEIDRVFKNGRTVKGSSLFIKSLDSSRGYSRWAFIVPSKYVPLAVDRNKVKRSLSGEVARKPFLLEKNRDVIVVVSKKVARREFKGLVKELSELLSKI